MHEHQVCINKMYLKLYNKLQKYVGGQTHFSVLMVDASHGMPDVMESMTALVVMMKMRDSVSGLFSPLVEVSYYTVINEGLHAAIYITCFPCVTVYCIESLTMAS